MERISARDLELRRIACINILKQFNKLNTALASMVYLMYLAEYLLCTYAIPVETDSDEFYIGASKVVEVTGSTELGEFVKLRNALIHCDIGKAIQCIEVLRNIDYCDGPDGVRDLLSIRLLTFLTALDWTGLTLFLNNLLTLKA